MATIPKRPSNSIRIDSSTHQKLRHMAYSTNTPIVDIVAQAVDLLFDETTNGVKTIPLDELSAIIRKHHPNIVISEKMPEPIPEWLE